MKVDLGFGNAICKVSCRFFLIICGLVSSQNLLAQTTLYSRTNGNWSNNTTWSTVSPGGSSCSCIPTSADLVIIDGYSVTLDADSDAKSLTVQNTSTLTFNDGIGLDINAGTITIADGSTLTHSGEGSGAHIDFEAGNSSLIVNSAATFSIDDTRLASTSNLTIAGGGNVGITDDLVFVGGATLVNNLTGNLNLTGTTSRLQLPNTGSASTLTNNGTINISEYLHIDSDNNTITNNGMMNFTGASYGILVGGGATGNIFTNNASKTINIAGNFNVNFSAGITFNNNGILDLEGSLVGWNNSIFHNLSGSTLYLAGTGQFYGDFYANYDANTVVFDNTSTLQNELINPTDNYWNLTFSGFQKQMKSNITCKGDFMLNTNAYITSNRTITMDNAGSFMVANGASLTSSTGTGTLTFSGGHTYNLQIDDATTGFEFEWIELYDNATVNLTGSGKVNMQFEIALRGANSTFNNNFAGDLDLRSIAFFNTSSGSTFVNNQTIDLTYVFMSGSGNSFVNNKDLTLTGDITFSSSSTGANTFTASVGSNTIVGDDIVFSATNATLSNGGTMSLDQLFFGAGSNTFNTSGTVTCSGALVVNDATFDGNTVEVNSGGVLNVAGEFHLSHADFTFNNSGTANLTGRFDDMNGSEQINNLAGGTINYYGFENFATHANITLNTSSSNNTFNYARSGDQDIIIPADGSYWNLTLSGSGDKTMEAVGTESILGDLNILGTSVLDVSTNGVSLTVGGNWTNSSGNFLEGTGTVTFNGSAAQAITAPSEEIFYNLVNSNTGGDVTMSVDVHVDNQLTLTDGTNGKFIIGTNNLTIDENASIAGGDITEFIVTNSSGYLRQEGVGASGRSGSILYPIGTSVSNYNPATISNLGTVDRIDIKVRPIVLEEGTSGTVLGDQEISVTWDIEEQTAGGSNMSITLQWNASDEGASFDRTDCFISHYDGRGWWDPQQDHTNASGSDPYQLTISGQQSFSPFSIGSGTSLLPIELVDFQANYGDKKVLLKWVTATETNNDFFEIQRSEDGKEFHNILRVESKGNSNETKYYEAIDRSPYPGLAYYRLKQTDFDGTFTYSWHVTVDSYFQKPPSVVIFPVPLNDEDMKLRFTGFQVDEKLTIKLLNLLGNVIYSETIQNKTFTHTIDRHLIKFKTSNIQMVVVNGANDIAYAKYLSSVR